MCGAALDSPLIQAFAGRDRRIDVRTWKRKDIHISRPRRHQGALRFIEGPTPMVMTLRQCHDVMKDQACSLLAELGSLPLVIVGFEKYTDRRWVFAVSVASPAERRMSADETRDRLAEHNCDRYSMIAEGWLSKSPEAMAGHIRPSEDPARQDALTILSVARGGRAILTKYIVRKASQGIIDFVLEEPECDSDMDGENIAGLWVTLV
jgi:hypothetical protein